MLNKERIGAIIFLIFGIAVTLMGTQIRVQANLTEPGPRLFPYISGIGMAICGLGMFINAIKDNKTPLAYLDHDGWKRLGVCGLTLILYYFGLEYLGFLISTPIFTFAIILILGNGKKISKVITVVVAVITTGLLYFTFESLFSIFLPSGKLFF